VIEPVARGPARGMLPEPNDVETRVRNTGRAPLGRDYNNSVTLVLGLLDPTRSVDQLRECEVGPWRV
jgi:hypothetical protein